MNCPRRSAAYKIIVFADTVLIWIPRDSCPRRHTNAVFRRASRVFEPRAIRWRYTIDTIDTAAAVIVTVSSASGAVLRRMIIDDDGRRTRGNDVQRQQVRRLVDERRRFAPDDQPSGLGASVVVEVAIVVEVVIVVVVVVVVVVTVVVVLVVSRDRPVGRPLLLFPSVASKPFDGEPDQEKPDGGRERDSGLHQRRAHVEAQVEERVQRVRQFLHFLRTTRRQQTY